MGDVAFTTSEARHDELAAVLAVQHAAFRRIADELGIPHDQLPPLAESVGDLEQLAATGWRFFVARDQDGNVIGTVRAARCNYDPSSVEVGRLGVDSKWLRRGVARALMRTLEDAYPDAHRFELFTGHDAAAPLALYNALGYTRFATETVGDDYELVWLERVRERL